MTRFALLLALTGALILPSAAGALTLGSTAPEADFVESGSSSRFTVAQVASPAGDLTYTVPPGNWVVKSVSAKVKTGTGGSVAIRFARPTGAANHYVFQGHDPLSLDDFSTKVYTATTDRKVQGGDVLSVTYGGEAAVGAAAPAGFPYGFIAADAIDGDDTELAAVAESITTAISAELLPDADADGFDDSADACPLDAERHEAPCATDNSLSFSVTPTTVLGGQDVTATIVLTNKGPARSTNIVIHIPYGQRFRHGSFPAECTNRQAETQCTLPVLEAGQSKTLVGKITSISPNTPPQAGSPVTETLSAYTESDNRDLNKADNNPPAVAMTVLPIPVGGTTQPAKCTVPKLKGKSRAKARSALKKANCALGKVKKPKGRLKKGRRLVVKKQTVPAGTPAAVGTKVGITLKAVKK